MRFKKLEKQKEKGLLQEQNKSLKVTKNGLVLKRNCTNCSNDKALLKSKSKKIKCTKCGAFLGGITQKDDKTMEIKE